MKRVLVLHAQVPFVRGGAEMLVDGLVDAINTRMDGVRAEMVALPFKWYPEEQILSDVMAWRMLDLSESNGQKVDLIIGTKFPTYAAQHANKVLWLVHQHRCFYDLEGTKFDKPVLSPTDLSVRNKVRGLDRTLIQECKNVFTIARNVSDRLESYSGLDSTPLFPPTIIQDKVYEGEYSNTIVCIARLDTLKRQDLLVQTIAKTRNLRAVFVGKGDLNYLKSLQDLAKNLGVGDRCDFLGFVTEDVLLRELSNARAVFYSPLDEDYGFATLEGFLAKKPVITCKDSGEVRRFVEESGSGWVCETDPQSIAFAMEEAAQMSSADLTKMASNGHEIAKNITWDNVLNQLVRPYL